MGPLALALVVVEGARGGHGWFRGPQAEQTCVPKAGRDGPGVHSVAGGAALGHATVDGELSVRLRWTVFFLRYCCCWIYLNEEWFTDYSVAVRGPDNRRQ